MYRTENKEFSNMFDILNNASFLRRGNEVLRVVAYNDLDDELYLASGFGEEEEYVTISNPRNCIDPTDVFIAVPLEEKPRKWYDRNV